MVIISEWWLWKMVCPANTLFCVMQGILLSAGNPNRYFQRHKPRSILQNIFKKFWNFRDDVKQACANTSRNWRSSNIRLHFLTRSCGCRSTWTSFHLDSWMLSARSWVKVWRAVSRSLLRCRGKNTNGGQGQLSLKTRLAPKARGPT